MKDISNFLINTGRTLSQMALYSPEHPSVKGAIQEAFAQLTEILRETPELVISLNDKLLLINGKPVEGVVEMSLRPFTQLLQKFDLHSLSFYQGIEEHEIIPFFRLASRGDIRKTDKNVSAFFDEQNVTHIKANQAKYTKIAEGQTVGGKSEGESAGAEKGSVWSDIEKLPLNDLLLKLISKAVGDPKEQEKIFAHALGLVKKEIEQTVKRVTEEFGREKTQLTNERARTESVVENMADGMVVVDEKGNVLMMNPAAEQLYGVKLGECVGKPLWEGIREEQMIALAKDLTIPTDRPVTKEVQVRAAQETKKTLRASTAAVQDTSGRVVGLVSVLSDVTKQKELTRMQNEFMANVTHELRTPIHAIKLAIGAILEGSAGQTSPEQQKMLGLATRNMERLSRLIDDLLDFSKMESGAMEIHPHTLDLPPLLAEAAASLDTWSKSRSVTLTYEEARGLPPVFADADRVLQVVVNLLSNAIKFTPAGGRVTLRAKTVQDGKKDMVRIDVQDTGKGISAQDQQRVFQKFMQLKQQEKTEIRGTGLGLSICQALVDLHKGKLSVQSPPPDAKGGSLFSFTLPMDQVVTAAPVKAAPAPMAMSSRPAPKRGFWGKIMSKFKMSLWILLLLPLAAEARPRWGQVRRVIDADIIQLADGSKVRYLGVDAPNVGSAYYPEALASNKNWVENKEVRLEYGLQERDIKGLWLAYVYVDGQMVNEELVREGMAVVADVANEEAHLIDLLDAEKQAQEKKRGLWKDTPIETYTSRKQKSSGFPWATLEEMKKGIKK